MSSRTILGFGKAVFIPLCLIITGALTACGAETSLSANDLQTCADTVAELRELVTFPVSQAQMVTQPYLITPGDAQITVPLNGSVLPFDQVKILFTQPPADPYISQRSMRIYVTPIDSVDLSAVFYPFHIVPSSISNFEAVWKPTASGKFIILILFRNFKPGGSANGSPKTDFGPSSVGYACVKIRPPQAGASTVGPVEIQPVQNFPSQTATLPIAATATMTLIPTSSPTFTPLPTLTITSTRLPTRMPPTWTPIPPSSTPEETVACSAYLDERSCNAQSMCEWKVPPTGGPGSCTNK